MNNFLAILRIFCVFIVLLSGYSNLKASHFVGGNITYTCLGKNPDGTFKYRFRWVLYRDCDGIEPELNPGSSTFNFTNKCGLPNPISRTSARVVTRTLTPVCQGGETRCENPGDLSYPAGIEEIVYEVEVDLAPGCDSWRVNVKSNARNDVITTIRNPGSTDFYVEAMINTKVDTPACNNSPQYQIPPYFDACANQDFFLNPGAYDPDKDSLAYRLICSRSEELVNVSFSQPALNCSQPALTNPPGGASINERTGDIVFKNLVGPQVFIFAIQILEYRNGVLIGTTMRDIQVKVGNCPSRNPVINNDPTAGPDPLLRIIVNGSVLENDEVIICRGQPLKINLSASDPDVNDSVYLTAPGFSARFPGSTFVVQPGKNPVQGEFNWIAASPTDCEDLIGLVFEARDNACPVNLRSSKGIRIFIVDSPVSRTDTAVCPGTAVKLPVKCGGSKTRWTANPPDPTLNSSLREPTVSPTVTTTYTASNGLPGCSDARVTISVDPPFTASASATKYIVCAGETSQLNITTTAPNIYTYRWSPGSFLSDSTIANPVFTAGSSTRYVCTVSTAIGCIDTAVINITVIDPSIVAALEGVLDTCENTRGLTYTVPPIPDATYSWRLTGTGHNITAGQGTNQITVDWAQSSGADSVIFLIQNQCSTFQAGAPVRLEKAPNAIDISGPLDLCPGAIENYAIVPQPNVSIKWNVVGAVAFDSDTNPTIRVEWGSARQTRSISCTITARCGTQSSNKDIIFTYPPDSADITGPLRLCAGTIASYTIPGTPGTTIEWQAVNGTIQSGQGTNVVAVEWGNTTPGQVIVKENNKCGGYAKTLLVELLAAPFPDPLADKRIICVDDIVSFTDRSQNADTWSWSFGDGGTANIQNPQHQYTRPGTYDVTLITSISGQCPDTVILREHIRVLPYATRGVTANPNPGSLSNQPLVRYTGEFADTVYWKLVDTATGWTHIERPPFRGITTKYLRKGIYQISLRAVNQAGCGANDTITVEILPDAVLIFPNAFTPNGDSANEVFRYIAEGFNEYTFRVFNRWGELLYTQRIGEPFWPGSYADGRPAPEGVYVYTFEGTTLTDRRKVQAKGTITLFR
jgi:gliding motility-associated-like protein